MAMPSTVTIEDTNASMANVERVFQLFTDIDQKFSVFTKESPVSLYRSGTRSRDHFDEEERYVWDLSLRTKQETNGYFDAFYDGSYNPTGIVKGYAIHRACRLLQQMGYRQYLVEIAGDGEAGTRAKQLGWRVGISNPFNKREIVKVVQLADSGIATSGIAEHPDHIVNPHTREPARELASMTVIARDAEEADRLATAAFAMGVAGISYIESRGDAAAYAITADKRGIATTTFKKYEITG